jgi:hypothetical protein
MTSRIPRVGDVRLWISLIPATAKIAPLRDDGGAAAT